MGEYATELIREGTQVKTNWGKELGRVLVVLVGIAMDALGVCLFLLPYNFPVGGITGIARIVNHFGGLRISMVVAVVSVLFFGLGYFLVGKAFAMKTLIGTVAYPLFLAVFETIDPSMVRVDDKLLAATYAGLCMGIGLGLCVRNGSSTGGTDLVGVVLHKHFRIPVATVTYAIDVVLLGIQLLFGNFTDILYGIFIVILSSVVMDKVIMFASHTVQVMIVSSKHEEINEKIQEHPHIGSTLLYGETGRFHNQQNMIISTVKSEYIKELRDIVYEVDQTAFMTMMNVSEVYGRGFSMESIWRDTK